MAKYAEKRDMMTIGVEDCGSYIDAGTEDAERVDSVNLEHPRG